MIQSRNFREQWSLDPAGNWPAFQQDTDADEDWDLDQSRSHDTANQITQIDSFSTHVAHDAAGNMSKAPKPASWSARYELTWDARNGRPTAAASCLLAEERDRVPRHPI